LIPTLSDSHRFENKNMSDKIGTNIIKKRKIFPTDDSAKKAIFLAVKEASRKWTMPIRNWKPALNRFVIEFESRLGDYL